MAPSFNHPAFSQVDHRPWPLPKENWLLTQTWLNLAFIHWEIEYDDLRARIPAELEIDLYEGKAWIAIVPFDMKGVTFRNCPKLSYLSDFPEINVRSYVSYRGKPGVWFFSLDVPSRFTTWTARTFFHLPYRQGAVSISEDERGFEYRQNVGEEVFKAIYNPLHTETWSKDSFEKWSTERYCLYCQSKKGSLYRTEVHHPQWPLQKAVLNIEENSMLENFKIKAQHPSVLFSNQIEVVAYPPKKLT
jgi:uncharacterized protein YqjF (DUF2071 family)